MKNGGKDTDYFNKKASGKSGGFCVAFIKTCRDQPFNSSSIS
jgi:hypothetical protein